MRIINKLNFSTKQGVIFWIMLFIVFALQLIYIINEPLNIFPAIFFILTCCLFYYIVNMDNILDSANVISFLYIFNNVIFAAIIKTILYQPLYVNLYSPITSYYATFIATISLFLSIFTAKKFRIGEPIFKAFNRKLYLKCLSIYCFFIGFFTWALNQKMLMNRRASDYSPEKSFGGFAAFDDIFFMSIIAATSYVLVTSKNKKSLNFYIIGLIGMGIIMAFIESRKLGIAVTYLAYILPCIFHRYKITKKQIGVALFSLFFIFFVYTPIVHINRSIIWFLPFEKKFEYIKDNYKIFLSPSSIQKYYLKIKRAKNERLRYNYFNAYMSFFDRFASIQINDDIISAVNEQGLTESTFYFTDYLNILPSFIYNKKDLIAIGDRLRWEYGIKRNGAISFSLAPLICNSYAAFGMIGVFGLSYIIFLFTFLILKKIGWNLKRNVYAIYFLLPFVFNIHQYDHSQFITQLFRTIPVNVIIFLIFNLFYWNIMPLFKHNIPKTAILNDH